MSRMIGGKQYLDVQDVNKIHSEQITKEQKKWISSGKIGCVFASALVKQADRIGWKFRIITKENLHDTSIDDDCYIMSFVLPDMNIKTVKEWALTIGMYLEDTAPLYQGLRIKLPDGTAWVQYFGPDSHVKTRQAPYPMLSFTVRKPPKYYAKVGWAGVLHLAHASVQFLTGKKADTLWNQSIAKTKKELGHSPTIREAAKTTYEKTPEDLWEDVYTEFKNSDKPEPWAKEFFSYVKKHYNPPIKKQ